MTTATPVVGDFSEAISKPGSSNDLTEVALALPGLAQALVDRLAQRCARARRIPSDNSPIRPIQP